MKPASFFGADQVLTVAHGLCCKGALRVTLLNGKSGAHSGLWDGRSGQADHQITIRIHLSRGKTT
jgi:hypothetical protein